MKKQWGENGSLNVLLVPVILLVLLFIGATSFAVWAFSGRQDYKNNVDTKITAAVTANKQVVQAADAVQYAEAAKSPLKSYVGPDAYGSVHISYPKTWSAYIDTSDPNTPLNAYFHPDFVPATDDPTSVYALRVQVVTQAYSDVIASYQGQVQAGTVTAMPYTLAKVPSVVGTRIDGQITDTAQGTMIILPLRAQTLEIWTESSQFAADFSTYVLPNLSFSP